MDAGRSTAAVRGAGRLGPVIATAVALGTAFKRLHDAVVSAANEQQAANFTLAEFSARMASVQAQAEVREVFRNKEEGDRTADTARYLNESIQEYRDATKEFRVHWQNAQNNLKANFLNVISGIIRLLEPVAAYANKKLFEDGPREEELTFGEVIKEMQDEDARRHKEDKDWFDTWDYSKQRDEERF